MVKAHLGLSPRVCNSVLIPETTERSPPPSENIFFFFFFFFFCFLLNEREKSRQTVFLDTTQRLKRKFAYHFGIPFVYLRNFAFGTLCPVRCYVSDDGPLRWPLDDDGLAVFLRNGWRHRMGRYVLLNDTGALVLPCKSDLPSLGRSLDLHWKHRSGPRTQRSTCRITCTEVDDDR